VKVLDFGLAKVYAGDSAAPDLSHSPTVTVGGTREGVILGTAAYLSPEQARGRPLDKRTDIWAFGCVLYEMLVGRPPFYAETTSETLAKILEREPNWDALPLATPPSIKNLLRRCLHKNLHHRLRDVGDARIEIDEAAGSATAQIAPAAATRRRIGRLSLVAASAVAGAVAALSVFLMLRPASTPTRLLTRFATALAPNEEFFGANMPAVALSPDGTRFAYTARRGGARQLYLRSIDSLEGRAIAGTEGAHGGPFFSPDGQWIGFFAAGKLKKVAVTGGEPVALADVAAGCGASWAADDTIVFSPTQFSGVMQVSASGGVPRMLTRLDPKQGDI
jgi:serine/threonine-protein kinase